MARPKGSRNTTTVVTVAPSRCPCCGSTRRSEYLDRTAQEYRGVTSEGLDYNLIVRRRTQCLDCDQMRIDRSLEFDPTLEPEPQQA